MIAKDSPQKKAGQIGPEQKKSDVAEKRGTEGHRPQDLNGDGEITPNEWPDDKASFRELDRDGDGVLTKKDRALTKDGKSSGADDGARTRMYDRPVSDYGKGSKPKANND